MRVSFKQKDDTILNAVKKILNTVLQLDPKFEETSIRT